MSASRFFSRVADETIALPQTSIMMVNELGDELSEREMLTLACSIIPAAWQQLLEITVAEFDWKQSEVGIRRKLVAIVANGILNGFQYSTLTTATCVRILKCYYALVGARTRGIFKFSVRFDTCLC